jgi:hypothetical protein
MARMTTFSVIIAVHNGSGTIRWAIESVLGQTYRPLEVIVVDDGSTDETAEEVARYGASVRYIYQKNMGVSAARNMGVSFAQGDWLAFLDADDWYYPDRLRLHAEWIQREPELDFLTGNFESRSPDGRLLRVIMEITEIGMYLSRKAAGHNEVIMEGDEIGKFVEQHIGNTHTLSLPRQTFLELGGYPKEFSVCEDVNFLIRLCSRSRRIGVVCQPLAVYTIHEQSATRSDPLRAQQQTIEALLSLEDHVVEASAAIRAGLQARIRRAYLNMATVLLKQGCKRQALQAVLPLCIRKPGIQSLKDILSVSRGIKNYSG